MDDIYDDGSIAASLEDFEHHDRSPTFNPSLNNSAFRSEESEAESERSSAPWSPPAWRKGSSGWAQQHRFPPPGASISHSTSPLYESAGEGDMTLLPRNVPLPPSPPKDLRPSYSPAKSPEVKSEYAKSEIPELSGGGVPSDRDRQSSAAPEGEGNYIRFSLRADMQHRTDHVDSALFWVRTKLRTIFATWTSTAAAFAVAMLAFSLYRALLSTPTPLPTPDMLKATQLAGTFEPLIYYSESGVQHVQDIHETGVAVWDLGESVRHSEFPSRNIIAGQLDDLSESFKQLAMALTSFFANIEGDVDSILQAMEWSKIQLETIDTAAPGTTVTVRDNVHAMLSKVGILDSKPNPIAWIYNAAMPPTPTQRNAATLRRTFNEFLNTLEEAINNEIQIALKLLKEFDLTDRQLLNIQRMVVRETDNQDREEDEMLSSLWIRVLGPARGTVRKFEKNKAILSTVHSTSRFNKKVLVEHNGKLQQLKENLEVLRKRMVSPLIRSNDTSPLSIEGQIMGLDNTYTHLKKLRDRQRRKSNENLAASLSSRVWFTGDEGAKTRMGEIEGGASS